MVCLIGCKQTPAPTKGDPPSSALVSLATASCGTECWDKPIDSTEAAVGAQRWVNAYGNGAPDKFTLPVYLIDSLLDAEEHSAGFRVYFGLGTGPNGDSSICDLVLLFSLIDSSSNDIGAPTKKPGSSSLSLLKLAYGASPAMVGLVQAVSSARRWRTFMGVSLTSDTVTCSESPTQACTERCGNLPTTGVYRAALGLAVSKVSLRSYLYNRGYSKGEVGENIYLRMVVLEDELGNFDLDFVIEPNATDASPLDFTVPCPRICPDGNVLNQS
jgi:hypothetical protein